MSRRPVGALHPMPFKNWVYMHRWFQGPIPKCVQLRRNTVTQTLTITTDADSACYRQYNQMWAWFTAEWSSISERLLGSPAITSPACLDDSQLQHLNHVTARKYKYWHIIWHIDASPGTPHNSQPQLHSSPTDNQVSNNSKDTKTKSAVEFLVRCVT